MPGLIQSLETGKSALVANQTALSTSEHNIANVNTPGYTRQEVVLEATPPYLTSIGGLGTGVQAADVRRVKDLYIDSQIQKQQSAKGELEIRQTYLRQIESALNESNAPGLGKAMSEFFGAYRSLAENPSGVGERKVVREKATQLINTFKRTNLLLHQTDFAARADIEDSIAQVNNDAEEIARLNQAIAGKGGKANDLKDQRDKLLGDLSKLVEIETLDHGDNLTVYVGGKALVDGSTAKSLAYRGGKRSGEIQIAFKNGAYYEDITNRVQGGKLGGLIEVVQGDIPSYLSQLDHLAYVLGGEVNSLHRQGYDLNGQTGQPFFVLMKPDQASDQDASRVLELAEPIRRSEGAIAAAKTLQGLPGDNRTALAIAGLWNNQVIAKPGSRDAKTFSEYLGGIVSDVGGALQRMDTEQKTTAGVLEQLTTQRDSVSGVSLDEEMITLTRYQRAFQAASQSLLVTQNMFDSLLGIVRGS